MATFPFLLGAHLNNLPAARARLARVSASAALGVLWLTLASHCRVPLWGAAVPLTLQPQAVLLLAATLGARRALLATSLWLCCGLRGWPVLASGAGAGVLFGPAFGYLASYLLVAPLVGRFGRGRGPLAYACWLVGSACTLLGGACALRPVLGSWSAALMVGVAPFWLADLAKTTAAFAVRAKCMAPRSA